MNEAASLIRDCFKGALLGTAVGDALGMPVEGWHCEDIKMRYGVLEDMADARAGKGRYTDDTEMMIALAESLLKKRNIDKSHLAKSFLDNFHEWRGYGPGTKRVLHLILDGLDINQAAVSVFPGGSFGNGAVMRVAPIALAYLRCSDSLKQAAYAQSEVTHFHPVACEGAYLQAYVIRQLIKIRQESTRLEPREFLAQLSDSVSKDMEIFYKVLKEIGRLLRKIPEEREVIEVLGNDVTTLRSWPTALYAFFSHWSSFEQAVIYAVNLGGDSDTIGAMTGALAGAFHGASAIPEQWLNDLEDGEKGRTYIASLAEQLFYCSEEAEG